MVTQTDDASVRTVLVAVAANLLIAVAKGVTAALTGSAAMLAETTHSIADTCNELLLYVGVRRGMRPADDRHPLGYGQAHFFWSLLAAAMGVAVAVVKLAGAAVALAAVVVRPDRPRRPVQLLGMALWGAFGLLALYSAGNLFITVGTVSGLLAPSAAWTAAGGVTVTAILYVLFFLAGAALFGMLAVWFHRRHHLRWTSAVAGLAGAPLLLWLLLAAAPAILGRWGLLPT